MNYAEVTEYFLSSKDDKLAAFTERLTPGAGKVMGLRIPFIKDFLKRNKEHAEEFTHFPVNEYYETDILIGLSYACLKIKAEEKITLIVPFVRKMTNWAVCDVTAAALKIKPADKKIWFEFAESLITEENEYAVRFGIVIMLDYFLDKEYIERILKDIDNLNKNEYYINMAIAWLVSVAYIKQKEYTAEYLKHNKLSDFTHNTALRKIRESFRVSEEDKDFVRTLKRN